MVVFLFSKNHAQHNQNICSIPRAQHVKHSAHVFQMSGRIWFSLFYAFGSSAQAQVILAWLEARERACPQRMGAVVGCCRRHVPLIENGLDPQRELEGQAAPSCPQPASPGGSVFQRSPRSGALVRRRPGTPPLDSDRARSNTKSRQATPPFSAARSHHHVHGGGHRRRPGAATA